MSYPKFNNYWGGQNPNPLQTANRSHLMGLQPTDQNKFIEDTFGDNNNLNQEFDLGLNMGTLQLGTAALGAWNGFTANKRAKEANQIARNQLNQNAEAFNINTGMQVATLNDEIGRYNAHAGGFLDESQRRNTFDADQFGKLSTYS